MLYNSAGQIPYITMNNEERNQIYYYNSVFRKDYAMDILWGCCSQAQKLNLIKKGLGVWLNSKYIIEIITDCETLACNTSVIRLSAAIQTYYSNGIIKKPIPSNQFRVPHLAIQGTCFVSKEINNVDISCQSTLFFPLNLNSVEIAKQMQ